MGLASTKAVVETTSTGCCQKPRAPDGPSLNGVSVPRIQARNAPNEERNIQLCMAIRRQRTWQRW